MGALSERGLGGPSPMPQKIIGYVKSGNSKSEYSKNDLYFPFSVASESTIGQLWDTLMGWDFSWDVKLEGILKEMEIVFEIPTIGNLRIDISDYFLW